MADEAARHGATSKSARSHQLFDIRRAVLRRMRWAVAILGGLVLLNVEHRLISSGQYMLGLIYLAAYVGIIAALSIGRIPDKIRAVVPLAILFAVGSLEFWLDRLHSFGLMYYLGVVVIAGALFSSRAVYIVVALCAGCIVAFGVVFTLAPEFIALPEPRHVDSGLAWRAAFLSFAMLALITTALNEQLFRGLRENIEASESYLARLQSDLDERKRLEDKLRKQDARLRAIVESSRDWIWEIDLAGCHTYCNPAVQDILGYEAEELVQASALDFLHPEDKARVAAFLPEAVRERRGWECMLLRWRHKNGEYRYLESSAVAVFDAQGELTGFQGVDRDVTDRIESDRALRESEDRYRSLFEEAYDAIFLLEGDVIIDCNPCALTMFGGTRDDIVGNTLARLSPTWQPEGGNSARAAMDYIQSVMDGAPCFFEWQYGRLDGKTIDAEVSLSRLDAGGQALVLAIVRDVSDRKEAEQALRRAEARTKAILYALPDSVFCLNRDGVHLDVHSQQAWSAAGARNSSGSIFEILPPDVVRQYKKNIAAVLDSGTIAVFEYSVGLPQDKFNAYEARMVPLESGVVLTMVRDITERKLSELHLSRYRDQLENLVKLRSKELEAVQEELLRKERLAALGTLIATVAHEIRNPLGTLRNALFSIRTSLAKGNAERVTRALQLADKSIGRCDGIITELLDFSKSHNHTKTPTEIDVWLSDVLAEQVIPDGVEVVVNAQSGCTLKVDAEQLRRAVICVFNNGIQAVQAEGASGNRLTVTTRISGDRLELRFEDSGPGIPAEIREQIYEPLFSTKSFGVGLGVPIARDIMAQYDGGLEFTDGKKGGTVAILWMPVENKAI